MIKKVKKDVPTHPNRRASEVAEITKTSKSKI